MVEEISSAFVRTANELTDLCDRLRAASRCALDTEFISERRFAPELGIIQVATQDGCWIIDPQAVKNLDGFCEVLYEKRIEKIVHAGRQDLEIFYRLGGQVPAPIFDTQIAAALVGIGEQVSYARLVEDLIGVSLTRHEGFTDWRERPLSPNQIEYALDDVRHLLAVADALLRRLRRLGRVKWAKEEFADLVEQIQSAQTPPEERYRQVRRWGTLSPKRLAVLRELAAWREAEAERRNRPRSRIIPDEVLVEIARRSPTSLAQLRTIRALNPGLLKRRGKELLEVVQRGVDTRQDRWPSRAAQLPKGKPPPGLVDLLSTVLRARAEELKIAPTILAKRRDLEQIALDPDAPVQVLHGWRRELIGRELLDVLEGRRSVGFDAGERRVKSFASPKLDFEG